MKEQFWGGWILKQLAFMVSWGFMLYFIYFKEGEDGYEVWAPLLLRWLEFWVLKFYVGHHWGQECNLNYKFVYWGIVHYVNLCIGEELLDLIV